jgi:hypothetical protein
MLDHKSYPQTFLRFGLQRKKSLLRDVRNAYDGLILPANILLYQYKSTPFVVYMCDKPFIIDPMSYLFGQPYEQFKKLVKTGQQFKPSFDRLMTGHGLQSKRFLKYSYEELLKYLQSSNENLKSFIIKALSFQRDMVWKTIKDSSELMTEEERGLLKEERYQPSLIIPPYFRYIKKNNKSIINELNGKILDYCASVKNEWLDIYPMIFIGKEFLKHNKLDDIISQYNSYPFDGYCIWIDNFDERTVEAEEIEGFINLVKALSNRRSRQILIMYGGYFSMLLFNVGVTCVAHGLAYGESKSAMAAVQQSSGPAPVRYYILELHRFLTLQSALLVLREKPELICNCVACRRIVRGNPENITKYEDEEALAEIHFLYNRDLERKMIGESTPKQIIEHLEWSLILNSDIENITKTYRVGDSYEERSIVTMDYMNEWLKAFKKRLK